MANRPIEKTTRTFSAPTYRVAGDPVPTGFNTREDAEKRAEQLDTSAAITDAYRNPNR